jgi:hypothetical protein
MLAESHGKEDDGLGMEITLNLRWKGGRDLIG